MNLSIIIPTFNESLNVAEMVARVTSVADGRAWEIVFVDDSTDDTPHVIERVAREASLPVRLLHRDRATGGLGGAVIEGLRMASADVCVVMDGDLQHPPEDVARLLERYDEGDADVVVASRYTGDGTAHGLANAVRTFVSQLSTMVTKAMFPLRLRNCSDPMTGFFLVDRTAIDLDGMRPRGFKILLEILARTSLRVVEIPFDFAERHAGDSKASFRQGIHFLVQLASLRFGKMSAFALIGALGAVVNIGIVWALVSVGIGYVWAAIVAAEITIIGNFLLQDRFVFRDMRDAASSTASRFAKSFLFNNAEAVVRIPLMALLVETWHISSVLATAITLAVAFFARFLFHSLVAYAPRKKSSPRTEAALARLDTEAMTPGEL